MTAATDRLAEIEGRAEGATEGPWVNGGAEQDVRFPDSAGHWGDNGLAIPGFALRNMPTTEDAAFIAHARTDVPRLTAALRAVLGECGPAQDSGGFPTSMDADAPDMSNEDDVISWAFHRGERAAGAYVRAAITAALSASEEGK